MTDMNVGNRLKGAMYAQFGQPSMVEGQPPDSALDTESILGMLPNTSGQTVNLPVEVLTHLLNKLGTVQQPYPTQEAPINVFTNPMQGMHGPRQERHPLRNTMIGLGVVGLLGAGGYLYLRGKSADRPAIDAGTAPLVDYDAQTGVFIPRHSPVIDFTFEKAVEAGTSTGNRQTIIFGIKARNPDTDEEIPISEINSLLAEPGPTSPTQGPPEITKCEVAKMVYEYMLNPDSASTVKTGVNIVLATSDDYGEMREVTRVVVGQEGC